MRPWSAELADIFSELQLSPLVSLLAFDQNQCLVPLLKDLFHICLEPEEGGRSCILNLSFVISK